MFFILAKVLWFVLQPSTLMVAAVLAVAPTLKSDYELSGLLSSLARVFPIDDSLRAAYDRALDAYEKSELALKKATNRRRLQVAADLIASGRRDAATARQAVSASGTTLG